MSTRQPEISHGELIKATAAWRANGKRLIWTEVNVGSAWIMNGVPVPDVLTLEICYRKPLPTVYEVKVTRADFQSDMRTNKWMSYLPFASRLWYVAPAGLLAKAEVPDQCGLLSYNTEKRTFTTVKPAPPRTVEWREQWWLSLLYVQRAEAVRTRDCEERRRSIENAKGIPDWQRLGREVRERLTSIDFQERQAKAALEAARDDRAIAKEELKHAQQLVAQARIDSGKALSEHLQGLAWALSLGPEAIGRFMAENVVGYQKQEPLETEKSA